MKLFVAIFNEKGQKVEEWKDIPGFDGLYQASTLGNIRSLPKKLGRNMKNGTLKSYFTKQRLLKPRPHRQGYVMTTLYKNGKRFDFMTHTLIAKTFIGDILKGFTVNHIDGVKNNNKVSNLEVISMRDNILHAWSKGLQKPNIGQMNGSSKLSDENVRSIKMAFLCGISVKELSDIYEVSLSCIKNIKSGRSWKHIILNTL